MYQYRNFVSAFKSGHTDHISREFVWEIGTYRRLYFLSQAEYEKCVLCIFVLSCQVLKYQYSILINIHYILETLASESDDICINQKNNNN